MSPMEQWLTEITEKAKRRYPCPFAVRCGDRNTCVACRAVADSVYWQNEARMWKDCAVRHIHRVAQLEHEYNVPIIDDTPKLKEMLTRLETENA